MKLLTQAILLSGLLLLGCSSNVNRALYESIKNQNEVGKTPAERAISPTPSYDAYKKERETLKQNDPVQDKKESIDFSLK